MQNKNSEQINLVTRSAFFKSTANIFNTTINYLDTKFINPLKQNYNELLELIIKSTTLTPTKINLKKILPAPVKLKIEKSIKPDYLQDLQNMPEKKELAAPVVDDIKESMPEIIPQPVISEPQKPKLAESKIQPKPKLEPKSTFSINTKDLYLSDQELSHQANLLSDLVLKTTHIVDNLDNERISKSTGSVKKQDQLDTIKLENKPKAADIKKSTKPVKTAKELEAELLERQQKIAHIFKDSGNVI